MSSIRAQLLLPFLRAKGQFISGAELGQRLGISRVSIHKHLEQIRSEGFVFSAIRNKGYRMEEEPFHFHPDLMEALLDKEPVPYFNSHLFLNQVDSTNSLAESELSSDRLAPFFIVADEQSSGRGRRGRTWHSPSGKNLYISIALRPSLPPARLQTITLWMGLRLCIFLRDRFSLPVQIKWPNDLMLHGKKIAGMLTEARVDSESTRDLIFGLGLNVNSQPEDFPGDLSGIAHSLAIEKGHPISLTRLAHSLIQVLASALEDFLEDSYSEELAQLWPEYDFLRGQIAETDDVKGVVLGIAKSGALRVQREDGTVAILQSGEVSLHKNLA